MKIIDFARKGNVVRFFLGKDDLQDWYGDDWNDTPYEHNAGQVYDEFISAVKDVTFSFDDLVLEPKDDWHNCGNSSWSKDDMIARRVPCLIVVPAALVDDYQDNFSFYVGYDGIKKYYFGDSMDK